MSRPLEPTPLPHKSSLMPRILFLTAYPEEDASCRYRVHQFVPYLAAARYECTIAPFANEKLFSALKSRGRIATKAWETLRCSARRLVRLSDVRHYDFVVIHREAFPFFAPLVENWVMRRTARSSPIAGTKFIFSFDDAIYAGHEDVSALNHPLLYRWKHGRGYDEIVRSCDQVIAGNRILAEYARNLNPRVTVIPTVVDCRKYRMKAGRDSSESVTIGWMGSRTTASYLRVVEPALKRLSSKHGDRIQFRFYGDPQYKVDLPNCEALPFRLAAEVEDLQRLDIGLMPLPDNSWTRGKCAFKAIQYMASGVAAVASPVGITSDLIQDNVDGFLASSEDEWFNVIDRLVLDTALRERITCEARRTIETSYSLEVWGPRFAALFAQLGEKQSVLQRESVAA
jgi:glycosyltransferase involved in cell wall biosynthesis